ncbi:MAG: hypothetical protein NVSMB6_18560 [Burkholderiaceae bacterium]
MTALVSALKYNFLDGESAMHDLNDANPSPPPEVKAKLAKAELESRKLDSPERTNDSTIDPEKPKEDILKGFHGG